MDSPQPATSQQQGIELVPFQLVVDDNGSGKLVPLRGENLEVGVETEVTLLPNENSREGGLSVENVQVIFDAPVTEFISIDSDSEMDVKDIPDEKLRELEDRQDNGVGKDDVAAVRIKDEEKWASKNTSAVSSEFLSPSSRSSSVSSTPRRSARRRALPKKVGGRSGMTGVGKRTRRARGASRGQGAGTGSSDTSGEGHHFESFHIGTISDEVTTVSPGVTLEQPLTTKRKRLLPKEEPVAEPEQGEWQSMAAEEMKHLPKIPEQGEWQSMAAEEMKHLPKIPEQGEWQSMAAEEMKHLPKIPEQGEWQSMAAEEMKHLPKISTSTPSRRTLSTPSSKTPSAHSTPSKLLTRSATRAAPNSSPEASSPSGFGEIPTSTPTSARVLDVESSPSTSPTKRQRCKKSLSFNVTDPKLEDSVNFGSDNDSDDEGGEDYLLDVPTRQLIDILDIAEDMQRGMDTDPSATQASEPSPGPSVGPNLYDFIWETLPQPPIDPLNRREKFASRTGPVKPYNNPYDVFTEFWDAAIMRTIARETNNYAEQCLLKRLDSGTLDGYSRILAWKDTDPDELYVFLAIILATGVVVKSDITEYWSVNNDIFDTPNFGFYMPYNRFIALGSMLHFVNNKSIDVSRLSKSEAKIFKIAPIVNHLNERFQAVYQLGQCVSLDESLTQWKGCLGINQIIKSKAASQGVKTYEVCDSSSGYLWRFKIYAGPEEGGDEYGYITSLVLQLLRGLENKGHTIFMDNFYNSPLLARMLKSQGFDCVGTLRLNRQYVPEQIKSLVKSTLPPGNVHGCTSGDVDLLVWNDRNVVSLLTTYHGASSVTRNGRTKPAVVHDYNVRMGGVDKKDQMLSTYPLERKRTTVWYKKMFRRLLNVSVLNSYIIYKESEPSKSDVPHSPEYTHRQFRKALVNDILAKHSQQREIRPSVETSGRVIFSEAMLKHIPQEFPVYENSGRKARRHCAICRKRISIRCPGCNVALCLVECFAMMGYEPN